MAGDLEGLCELVAARLDEGGLGDDVLVAPFGYPDCPTVVALVRPLLGEGDPTLPVAPAGRKCWRELQLVIGVYAMTSCGAEECHRRVAQLMSGRATAGSVLSALCSSDSETAFAEAGYTMKAGQPRGFTFAAYNSDTVNAYWAQVPLTFLYCAS